MKDRRSIMNTIEAERGPDAVTALRASAEG
jgi:hypothetical protein